MPSMPAFENRMLAASPLLLCTFPFVDFVAAFTFLFFLAWEEDLPQWHLHVFVFGCTLPAYTK